VQSNHLRADIADIRLNRSPTEFGMVVFRSASRFLCPDMKQKEDADHIQHSITEVPFPSFVHLQWSWDDVAVFTQLCFLLLSDPS
jgi:hypothetical protein